MAMETAGRMGSIHGGALEAQDCAGVRGEADRVGRITSSTLTPVIVRQDES